MRRKRSHVSVPSNPQIKKIKKSVLGAVWLVANAPEEKGTSFVTYLHKNCKYARWQEANIRPASLTRDAVHEIISSCMDTSTITVRASYNFQSGREMKTFILIDLLQDTHRPLLFNGKHYFRPTSFGSFFFFFSWMSKWWRKKKKKLFTHKSTKVFGHTATDCWPKNIRFYSVQT